MGWKRNAALVVVGAVVLIAAVVVYRTETYEPPAAVDLTQVKLAPASPRWAAALAASTGAAGASLTVLRSTAAGGS